MFMSYNEYDLSDLIDEGYLTPDLLVEGGLCTKGIEDELWKWTGWGTYYISTYGRVFNIKNNRFLKPKRLDNHGHLGFGFVLPDGRTKYVYYHRLMANAFIDNPNRLPIVRHLNDNPHDNDITNLAWGTYYDNHRDCVENGHYKPFDKKITLKVIETMKQPVKCTNLGTNEVLYFDSQTEAGRKLHIPQANIWKVLRGQRRQAGGYYFEEISKEEYKHAKRN